MFEMTHYDLTVGITQFENIEVEFTWDKDLFEETGIKKLARHFINIIEDIIDYPDKETAALDILSEPEKHEILYDFNKTEAEYPNHKTIDGLFEEQVEKNPFHTAVIFEDHRLTYQELNERFDRLAGVLTVKGVKPGNIVAIMVERSIEMLVGIMAILKTGGAYLPMAPDYPPERIRYMLADTNAGVVLAGPGVRLKARAGVQRIDIVSAIKAPSLNPVLTSSPGRSGPNTPAYIIFTSGTTGKPKGIIVEHSAVLNRLFWIQRRYRLNEKDVILQATSFIFDVSVCEMFRWIPVAGRLCFLPPGGEKDPGILIKTIGRNKVTTADFVPAMLNIVLEYAADPGITAQLASLRWVFTGVEIVGLNLVKKFNSTLNKINGTTLINAYGPTESTVDITHFDCSAVRGGNYDVVPIGRPIANTRIYILDRNSNIQPIGVYGELCISGNGLARGYLNRPELTGEKFIRPGVEKIHEPHLKYRKYHTGDLARWLPDGNIEFLGRIDHQVKIRGFRVELGEIENRLLTHENITDVVVTAAEKQGEKYLCAYIAAKEKIEPSKLKEALAAELPDYMIPSYIMQLHHIPLNTAGNVDRRALPEPGPGIIEDDYTAPVDPLEETLVLLWSEVLNLEKNAIGTRSNFFKLGGHSLKAIRLVSAIRKELNVKVSLEEIFKKPTIQRLAESIKGSTKTKYVPVGAAEKREYYVLSSAQKRLFIIQQMDKEGAGYNMPSVWVLEGAVDNKRLARTFRRLIARHESLRTSFRLIRGEPVQQIHDDVDFEMEYYDLAGNLKAATGIINHFIRAFDLSHAPLLRTGLIREGNSGLKHLLMIDMHHIISDGVSADIFVNDFISFYEGKTPAQPAIQYKDFSVWQNSRKREKAVRQQEEYWRKQFEDEIPVLNLPTDYPRPGIRSFEGSTFRFHLDKNHAQALGNLAKGEDVTLYMVLLAVFYILLSKLGGQEDIVVGTVSAGRMHPGFHQVMGMFVNTLALRNLPAGEKTFTAFLEEVKKSTVKAFENQDYPFEELVDKAAVTRDAGRNPLFDVMFALEDFDIDSLRIPGLTLTPFETESTLLTSKYDLTLTAVATAARLSFTIEYCTKLFKPGTIERFSMYYKKIISLVLKDPRRKISGIEIISAEEKNRLLFEFNGTQAQYPLDKTSHRLFEEQVERTPHHIAVSGAGASDELPPGQLMQVTYGELNEKANQLARVLREKGAGNDSIVGLMVEPGVEMMIGIMGILKAGGAYLPIDTDLPPGRAEYIVNDAAISVLLSQADAAGKIAFKGRQLNPGNPGLFKGPRTNPAYKSQPKDLAYVIYTSGSTGHPKGVAVEHSQLINFLYHMYKGYDGNVNAHDRCLGLTNIMFDVSVWEFFLPLVFGSRLVLLPKEKRFDVFMLVEAILREGITLIYIPPALLKEVNEQLKNQRHRLRLNKMLVGVEPIREEILEDYLRLNPRLRIINGYGPTETTICASWYNYRSHPPEGKIVPIGVPLSNYQVVLLDSADHLVPRGTPGEICISGEGVSRGYLNNPQLTAEKYTAHPYFKGGRMYRTGDLALWLPDGNMRFLGRIDRQVKIRGYRVELKEIENCLLKYENIRETVVLVRKEENGDKYICAYYVPASGEELSSGEIKQFLSDDLPHYMIPAYFIGLQKIPLTPNGKIDENALPVPEIKTGKDYVAPRQEIEENLVAIWSEILNINRGSISIDDDFFELGGHSLRATVMVSRVHKAFNVIVPLAQVFKTPAIRGLSRYIKEAAEVKYTFIDAAEKKEYYELSSAQGRLYIQQQSEPGSTAYNMPAVFLLKGTAEVKKFEDIFNEIIQRHEVLRTSFGLVEGEAVQKIADQVDFKITFSKAGEAEAKETLKELVKPFDLSRAPLFRVQLIHTRKERYFIFIDMHHIISDGSSTGIMVDDFARLLQGKRLTPLPVQYKDYAAWQNKRLHEETFMRQQEYWLKKLEGFVFTQFPADHFDSYNRIEGKDQRLEIEPPMYDKIETFCNTHGVTKFIFMIAVFQTLLAREIGQEDITIGIPASVREHYDLKNLIGVFLNVLLIRTRINEKDTFLKQLLKSKETVVEALNNQDYPYEMLDGKISGDNHLRKNPLFSILFNYFPVQVNKPLVTEDFEIRTVETGDISPKYDMTLYALDAGEHMTLELVYKANLYDELSIKRVLEDFLDVIRLVMENEDITISKLTPQGEEDYDDFDAEFEKYYDA
jgi:tyrocidine synthetase-3